MHFRRLQQNEFCSVWPAQGYTRTHAVELAWFPSSPALVRCAGILRGLQKKEGKRKVIRLDDGDTVSQV
jgi:hypothetical protein